MNREKRVEINTTAIGGHGQDARATSGERLEIETTAIGGHGQDARATSGERLEIETTAIGGHGQDARATSGERLEIETTASAALPEMDRRPKMVEPPPVKVVAVADVTLLAPAGVEKELDDLYVGLLGFRRAEEPGLVYEAENVRLIFDVRPGPLTRDHYRITQIQVMSLPEAERKLTDARIEFLHQRGLLPGTESLLLQDAAGNWLEIVEGREVM